MFNGISTELMGAAIYDLGKGIIDSVSKTEWVQATLKKWKLSGEQHDFAARYLETLVEFSMQDKPAETLNLFRSDDIRRTFFDFYYGTHDRRGSKDAQQHSLDQSIAALRVGDDVKASGVDVETEVSFFWTVFRQKVQESRTVKEVEIDQKLQQLQRSMDDVNQMLSGFKLWMQENGKTEIQVDGTIYNIDKIDNGFFNDLITKSHQSSSHNPTKITRHKPVKWVTDRPYVGRAKDVERLKSFFEHPQKPFFFLYGVGGIGKSHLLQVVDGNLKTKPAYFRLNESSKLSSLIRDLGYGDVDSLTPSQQHDYFLKKTAGEDQPLVFDDLYELPEDDIVFRTILELSNQPTGKFLVISRALPLSVDIKEERRLGLNELSENDFEEHLRDYHKAAHYDFELSPYLINACFKICKGYPLGGEFLLKLRDVSGKDFSADIDSIGEIDPKTDTSHREFMEHLLSSIFKKGTDKERELAKQMAVFMDPMPRKVFEDLPAFDADAFHALTERKKIFYALKGKIFGVHALVRKILETKNGVSYKAHLFAGQYYERMSQTDSGLDFESLFKAHFHFDRSQGGGEKGHFNSFLERYTPEYGELSVKDLLKRKDIQVLDKFRFKLLLKQDDESKLDVGRVLRHSGKLSEAISLFTSLIESGYLKANVELGIAYRESRDIAKAIEVLKKGGDAGNLYSLAQLGMIYREENRIDEAIAVLKKAADTGDPFSMNQLLITAREANRFDDLIEIYKKWGVPENDTVMTQLGMVYRVENRFDEAIEVLQKAADAGNIAAMNELGITYREAKRLPEAIEVLKKAVELGNIPSVNELGITYREAKRLPEAIEVLKKGADIGNIQSMNELGITYREAKRFDEAIAVLKKLADTGDIPSMNELGMAYRENQQLDQAIEIFKKAVELGNFSSMNELGKTYRLLNRLDEAIEVLEKAVDAGNIFSMNELGITYRESERFDKAIEVLEKAIIFGHKPSMNELGITYREAKRLPEAIKAFEKAVDAGNVFSMNELGIIYRKAKRFDEAIEVLRKSVDAGNIAAMNELGITYRETKQLEEAIKVLKKSIDEGNVFSITELGKTYREAKRFDEAIEVLKITADAGDVFSINELGKTYREAKRFDKAIEVLKKVADLGNVYAITELGISYREAQRFQEAIEVLKKGVDVGNIQSINELGITYREAKRFSEAIEVLKKGLEIKPKNTFLKYTLFQIYLLYKPNTEKAKLIFLEMPPHFPAGQFRKSYEQIVENFEAILTFTNSQINLYRTYIWLLFRYESWDWAVVFLEELIKTHPTIEFKTNLGKALSHIGRAKEAIPIFLAAMEDTSQSGKEKDLQRYTADYLDALKLAGSNKEARKKFEKYKHLLSSLPDFETRKAYWLDGQD